MPNEPETVAVESPPVDPLFVLSRAKKDLTELLDVLNRAEGSLRRAETTAPCHYIYAARGNIRESIRLIGVKQAALKSLR